jgi:two-component sensor histidine kinase
MATLLPLLLFALLTYTLVTENIKQRITEENRLSAVTMGREIHSTLLHAKRTALWLAETAEDGGFRGKTFARVFRDSLLYLPFFEKLIAADDEGIIYGVVPHSSEIIGTSIINRPYFRRVSSKNAVYWSGTFFSSISHSNSIVCAVPLREGVFAAHINLDWLRSLTEGIMQERERRILITDRNGSVIAAREQSLVEQRRNISNLPPVEAALSGGEGTFDFTFGETRYLCYASRVEATGWPLLIMRPYADAFSIQREAGAVLAVVMFISLIMAVFLSYLMGNRILAPLSHLAATANTIAQGNYSVTPRPGFQEMQSVSEALDFMSRQVEEREEALQSSLYEKDLLLMEIHHRVKNNLQLIMSILSLKYSTIADPEQRSGLNDTINHIYSIAQVHEQLYQNRDMTSIDLRLYSENLVSHLLNSNAENPGRIEPVNEIPPLKLSLDTAIPCGLILSELITNSLKHAFPRGEGGRITLQARHSDGEIRISYSDNGAGFPPEVFNSSGGMGFQIVHVLSQQLDGRIEYLRDGGSCFILTFPA